MIRGQFQTIHVVALLLNYVFKSADVYTAEEISYQNAWGEGSSTPPSAPPITPAEKPLSAGGDGICPY